MDLLVEGEDALRRGEWREAKLAFERALDGLFTFEPAARQGPRLVATVRPTHQQDASAVVADQAGHADAEAAITDAQVQRPEWRG